MTAAVPLSKVEFFRPILEENAYIDCVSDEACLI